MKVYIWKRLGYNYNEWEGGQEIYCDVKVFATEEAARKYKEENYNHGSIEEVEVEN